MDDLIWFCNFSRENGLISRWGGLIASDGRPYDSAIAFALAHVHATRDRPLMDKKFLRNPFTVPSHDS